MPYRQVIASSGKPARKAGKKVWQVDICVRGLPRYQKRHYGTRTEIARKEVKIHEQMLAQVGKVSGVQKDPTFSEFVKPLQKSWRTTLTRTKNIDRFLEATGHTKKRLSEFQTSDVIDFMRWRRSDIIPNKTKKAPSEVTIKRDVVCWKTMINLAVKSHEFKINYDFTNPVKTVKEEPKFQEGLSVEQYQKLVDSSVDYLKPILEFAANTGWRRSEIFQLTLRRVKHFDVGGFAILEDSKNREPRLTTIFSSLANIIENLPSWGTCDKCNRQVAHMDKGVSMFSAEMDNRFRECVRL